MSETTDKKFPIGFWNYPEMDAYGPEEVMRWVKCGITLNQSPQFDYAKHKKEDMLALLDECENHGIKLILVIEGLDYRSAGRDIAAYRSLFQRAFFDFGAHPAVYGFSIGDEPVGDAENNACIEAYKIHLGIAPELTPFLNFNPYFPGFEERVLGGQEFPEWAKEFTGQSGCRLICYDCYSQLNPGTEGTDSYFLNLKKYAEMADAAGIELWTTLLSIGHFRYRVPSEDDLRWQLNTAVASGCRGILWFYFYNQLGRINYRGAPVDEFGNETVTYQSMARVHNVFHALHGRLLYSLKHKKTWHFEKCYGTFEHFPQDTHRFIRRMNSIHRLPGIISFFEDAEGREYTVIVNNSPFESGLFEFILNKGAGKMLHMKFNGEKAVDFAEYHPGTSYSEEYDGIHTSLWLAPGQMEIFRFE